MKNSSHEITIAIADDHVLMRSALAELINKFEHMRVLFEANNGRHLLEQLNAATFLPDICILDYYMPEMDGYETLLELKRSLPHIKVLALTMYDNAFNIKRMLRAGASGYLMKDSQPTDLQKAIIDIHEKEFYYSEKVPEELFEDAIKGKAPLSEREMEYLALCAQSLPDKLIADKMGIKMRSVANFRLSICNKFDLRTKTDLISFAGKIGMIPKK